VQALVGVAIVRRLDVATTINSAPSSTACPYSINEPELLISGPSLTASIIR